MGQFADYFSKDGMTGHFLSLQRHHKLLRTFLLINYDKLIGWLSQLLLAVVNIRLKVLQVDLKIVYSDYGCHTSM